MAGGKLSPRQKMIGMMYLVLTALLAMNVSKDILNAFVTVNDGLEKTKRNFKDKNDDQYSRFEASYNENKEKVGKNWNQAQTVRSEANAVIDYIDQIKVEIIAGVEPSIPKDQIMGKNEFGEDTILNLMNVKVKDNYLVPTEILVGGDNANPKSGEYSALEIKSRLESFRDKMTNMLPAESALSKAITETFQFEEKRNASGVVENWPSYNFYGVPTAATLTLLTKMQTDVRNAESDVVKYLYADVDAASFKFNKLEAAVISPSNYVITGDTFRAQVFLAAFDSTQNPKIKIGERLDTNTNEIVGDTLPLEIKDGKGYLKIPAKTVGEYNQAGVIQIKNPSTKEYNPYYFDFDYKVASPSTTISATAMNVFYIGVDNPVDISAAGVPKDKVQASITNGNISKAKDGWVVKVKKPGKAVVNVAATIEGERKNMGNMEFRVKRIPTPVPEIAGKSSGAVNKNRLANTTGIIAKMENFEFDVRVVVDSYMFTYVAANGLSREIPVKGPRFTGEVKNIINRLKPGSRVTFENIKAKMPDGELRKLPPVVLKAI
ncbi:MAG: gliding motility protein GldM [Vicingaceae bacterium]